ncbi:NPL4 family-domain-containing protein [Gorgonomyces haynaldii]|nr:NPL4 family-domain-containing protein [Gorgonomyces haynaldii]
MLLRIRSPVGQARIDVQSNISLDQLKQKIVDAVKCDPAFSLGMDPQGKQPVNVGQLRHGDLIYVIQGVKVESKPVSAVFVQQLPLDNQLENKDGSIKRERDALYCTHPPGGMCDYCMPLPPYDAKYLESQKIKHMSFHSYLRQIRESGKIPPPSSPQFIPPLDEPSFKQLDPCPSKSHGPYPEGICSKCQPSAISLQSQNFRMVDHVEFESPAIVESFLQYWRQTGSQRFGYLYGRYEQYPDVPLGVKAVVATIYEPPQEAAHDWIQLQLPDPNEASVETVAKALGLVRIGCIYTDLFDDGTGKGTVVCKRHADSYFLSSQECIMAAQMQQMYPVPSKYSSTGQFGSRFVTCVISGNTENQIDIMSYQVSNACVGMVKDGIIEPTVKPQLMRVKPTSNDQYIPEVFYTYKNEYNLQVRSTAKPTFPVEYLLVTSTHGFPQKPSPTFVSSSFPIENRIIETNRNMRTLKDAMKQSPLLDKLSDFHLLLFLYESSIFDQPTFEHLCQAVADKSADKLIQVQQTPAWETFGMILQDLEEERHDSWSCRHCTYVNSRGNECEMCGLPKD